VGYLIEELLMSSH